MAKQLIISRSAWLYGQICPVIWPTQIAGMAKATIAIPNVTSMLVDGGWHVDEVSRHEV